MQLLVTCAIRPFGLESHHQAVSKILFFFYVQQVGSVLQDFSMSTAFPRRQFGTSDMDTSLLDLQLAPSAAVIILPVSPEKV